MRTANRDTTALGIIQTRRVGQIRVVSDSQQDINQHF